MPLPSFMDFLFPDEAETEAGKIANELGKTYFRARLVDKGLDWATGSGLKLPFTSDDYEDAVNNDESFITRSRNLAGQSVLQRINENILESKPMKTAIFGALPSVTTNTGRGLKNVNSGLGFLRRLTGR